MSHVRRPTMSPALCSRASRSLCLPLLLVLTSAGYACGPDAASKASGDTGATNKSGLVPPQTAIGDSSALAVAEKPPKLKRAPGADAGEWQDYRKEIRLKGGPAKTKDRGCHGAPEQHGDCLLEITPVLFAHAVDSTDVDSLGYIIAKIRNVGNAREAFFGILPRTTVYWRVYRRVVRDASGGIQAQLLTTQLIDSTTGTALIRPDPAPAESPLGSPSGFGKDEFPFRVCTHDRPIPPPRAEDVEWQTCEAASAAHRLAELSRKTAKAQTASEQIESLRLPEQIGKLRNKHNSPAWITCVQGCCAIEGGP